MRGAEQPRQVVAEAEVVDAVAELMEHRVHGVVGRDQVREDTDVPATVDVDAEGVLVLAVAREEIAPLHDAVGVEADSAHRATRERDDVLRLEQPVEVDRAVGRRLLEERIGVVPGPEV